MTRPALHPFLYATAAALLVVSVATRVAAERLWTPDLAALPDVPAKAPGLPTVTRAPSEALNATGLAAVVVSTNLFSPRRSAPGVRFGDSTPAPPPVPTPPSRPIMGLFGIGTSGGQATALIDADPGVPGAEIYHVGDALPGGGRVVRIADDHVVIDTPEGRQRLRLRSAP